MTVRELLAVLHQLRDLYEATGARAAGKDVAKVIALLAPHDGKPIETVMADVRAAATAAGAKKERAPAAVDEVVVDEYLRRLVDAGTDQGMFDEVLGALTNDPGVKLTEADAIARNFTRSQSPCKTKKAALTAIKQTFVERVRFENKLKSVS